MARKTTERSIKIGTKIQGVSCVYEVIGILKHAYQVVNVETREWVEDIWAFEVYTNAAGQLATVH